MSTARKILSNTVWQILGKIVIVGLAVISVKLITNYLGQAGYGDYSLVYEYLAFFGIVTDMGLFTIGVREMSKDNADKEHILSNILSIRIVLAILTMAAAVIVAFLIPNYSLQVRQAIMISALAIVFTFLASTVSSILQVHLKMQYATIPQILAKIITVAWIWWAVKNNMGFLQLFWAGLFGNVGMFILTYIFARSYIRIRLGFDMVFWKETVIKAFPYGLALILGTIYFRIDSLLLYQMKGAADVGIYGVPMKILEILVVIPLFFLNSALPSMTRHLTAKTERIKEIIQYSFDFLSILALPIVAGTLILAVPLILLVSSPEFLAAALPLKILIFAMALSFINSIFGFLIVAGNRQAKLLLINLICVIFNIVCNLLIIPRWSYVGTSVTTTLSELLILILTYYTVKGFLDFHIHCQTFFKAVLATVVMSAIIYPLRQYSLILLLPTATAIYFVFLWAIGGFQKEVINLIIKRQ